MNPNLFGHSKSIRSMMLRMMLAIFVISSIVLGFFLYHESETYATKEAEKKIKNLLLEQKALHAYIAKYQKPAIAKLKAEGKLYKEYFSPELLSSSYITRYMHQFYNENRVKNDMPELYYKLAANNPRNPANQSDTFESELIKKFNNKEIKEFKEVVEKDGKKILYYALPFSANTQDCMACHSIPDVAPKELVEKYGSKAGFHEKIGDIRAIISIRAPLAQDLQQAKSMFFVTAAITLGIILIFFVGGGMLLLGYITKPINRVVNGLNQSSSEIAEQSGQVSQASQQLAAGSSQQAASLEETTSSLEEMASMTRQNADNARQANTLMTEAGQVVDQANDSMGGMTNSMKEISAASSETAKIIKTIDEIAFQTNLLALNAAVEAARAGEAGAGFAVVADEVRSLAMRAAEAARNTANLIEGTVAKVKEGSDLVHKTAEDFAQVASSTGKVKELVAEIAAASNEQAQGVEQITKTIAEMDQIVQVNAATAEQSAGASQELSSQFHQVQNFVQELVVLVGGRSNGGSQKMTTISKPLPASSRGMQRRALSGPGFPGTRDRTEKGDRASHKGKSPEQLIPFDKAEFKDF